MEGTLALGGLVGGLHGSGQEVARLGGGIFVLVAGRVRLKPGQERGRVQGGTLLPWRLLVDVAECWVIFPGDVPDIQERVLNCLEGREVLREPAFNGCVCQVQRGLLVSSGPALG